MELTSNVTVVACISPRCRHLCFCGAGSWGDARQLRFTAMTCQEMIHVFSVIEPRIRRCGNVFRRRSASSYGGRASLGQNRVMCSTSLMFHGAQCLSLHRLAACQQVPIRSNGSCCVSILLESMCGWTSPHCEDGAATDKSHLQAGRGHSALLPNMQAAMLRRCKGRSTLTCTSQSQA